MRINQRDGEPLEEPLQFALPNGKKPQTFGEFRRRIVEELPEAIATDTGCADLLFPIELVCDIKERDVEWLTDLFDTLNIPDAFSVLATMYGTINLVSDVQRATPVIEELKTLADRGVQTPVLFFLGLIAHLNQESRPNLNRDFREDATQNLEDGRKWTHEIRRAIQNLLEAEVSMHRAGGQIDLQGSRLRYPGDTLKMDVITKAKELELEKPLKELESYIEAALKEVERLQGSQNEVIKTLWPKRSIDKVPDVRHA